MTLNELLLKFTPLEFETLSEKTKNPQETELKFTPLEFETFNYFFLTSTTIRLKFTPLEFETCLLMQRLIRLIS